MWEMGASETVVQNLVNDAQACILAAVREIGKSLQARSAQVREGALRQALAEAEAGMTHLRVVAPLAEKAARRPRRTVVAVVARTVRRVLRRRIDETQLSIDFDG